MSKFLLCRSRELILRFIYQVAVYKTCGDINFNRVILPRHSVPAWHLL
jgi:hypothetical protein